MNLSELNQMDPCLYVSCHVSSTSPVLDILLYVFAAAVVLFTVCGNLLVIVSVYHFKQLHTPTNMLILSLAVTDFLIGALVIPPVFIWVIEYCWILASTYCMCTIFVGNILANISIYNIVLIAVDRYFALSNPFLYSKIMTLRKIQIAIFSQWCIWMVYSSTLLYLNKSLNIFIVCPKECYIILNDLSVIVDFVTTLLFPCSVIIILYTGVFVIAKKHATAIRKINNLTRSETHKIFNKSERKAAKVLGILVVVFLTFVLPYFIYSLLLQFTDLKLEGIQTVILVIYINSTINPIIYALFYPWYKKCVQIILSLQIFKKDSSLTNVLS